jgi:hypothetical protein
MTSLLWRLELISDGAEAAPPTDAPAAPAMDAAAAAAAGAHKARSARRGSVQVSRRLHPAMEELPPSAEPEPFLTEAEARAAAAAAGEGGGRGAPRVTRWESLARRWAPLAGGETAELISGSGAPGAPGGGSGAPRARILAWNDVHAVMAAAMGEAAAARRGAPLPAGPRARELIDAMEAYAQAGLAGRGAGGGARPAYAVDGAECLSRAAARMSTPLPTDAALSRGALSLPPLLHAGGRIGAVPFGRGWAADNVGATAAEGAAGIVVARGMAAFASGD